MMDGSVESLSSSAASSNHQSSLNSALTDAAEAYNADNQTDSKGLQSSRAAGEGEVRNPNGLEKNQRSLGQTDPEPLNGEEFHGQGSSPDGEEIEDEGAFSADFELDELKLIEDALEKLRMKSGREPQLEHEDDAVDKASGQSKNAKQDLQDVGRLLKKVQAVRTQKREARTGDNRNTSTGWEELDSTSVRQAVQTASGVAFAAAEAVEKIARVVNKNSVAIERLSKTLKSSSSQQLHTDTPPDVNESEDGALRAIDTPVDEQMKEQIDITKDVIKQNRITHWVLGFIIVTSCIWRFSVYKTGKRVNHTLNNPFESFTGMFQAAEEAGRFRFPFQATAAEEEAKKKKQSLDPKKEGDNGPFNFGNMWPNGEQDKKMSIPRRDEERYMGT